MRWSPEGPPVTGDPRIPQLPTLVVSERNLRALLAKLQRPGSACALTDPDGRVVLMAEPDDVHYDPAVRARLGHASVPGEVHWLDAARAGIDP